MAWRGEGGVLLFWIFRWEAWRGFGICWLARERGGGSCDWMGGFPFGSGEWVVRRTTGLKGLASFPVVSTALMISIERFQRRRPLLCLGFLGLVARALLCYLPSHGIEFH